MATFTERKAERTVWHKGWDGIKAEECVACMGTGRYDHNGSPDCGSCEGAGKTRGGLPCWNGSIVRPGHNVFRDSW